MDDILTLLFKLKLLAEEYIQFQREIFGVLTKEYSGGNLRIYDTGKYWSVIYNYMLDNGIEVIKQTSNDVKITGDIKVFDKEVLKQVYQEYTKVFSKLKKESPEPTYRIDNEVKELESKLNALKQIQNGKDSNN